MRKRLRIRGIRSLPVLAVVLPLGAGAPEAERPPLPQEIVRDPGAAAAIGGVLRGGDRPYACAGVLVRSPHASRSKGTERSGSAAGFEVPVASLGPLVAEIGGIDPIGGVGSPGAAGGETRLDLRPAEAPAPPGFELWEGCAPLPEHLKEGRLRLSVSGAGPGVAGGESRITAVEVRPEIWTWRPVRAPEAGDAAEGSSVVGTSPADRGRGVAPRRGGP